MAQGALELRETGGADNGHIRVGIAQSANVLVRQIGVAAEGDDQWRRYVSLAFFRQTRRGNFAKYNLNLKDYMFERVFIFMRETMRREQLEVADPIRDLGGIGAGKQW